MIEPRRSQAVVRVLGFVQLILLIGVIGYLVTRFSTLTWGIALSSGALIATTVSILLTMNLSSDVVISMLGEERSGKTVYLTVLHAELPSTRGEEVVLLPYGAETIKRVSANNAVLRSGRWLPPTHLESEVPYRATASVGRFLRRRYTVTLRDFAGARTAALAESDLAASLKEPTAESAGNGNLRDALESSEFLQVAARAKAFFLAVDADRLLASSHDTRVEYESRLERLIDSLAYVKGATAASKMRAPWAIVLLKRDLVDKPYAGFRSDVPDELVVEKALDRISNRISNYSRDPKVFYVSSVGQLTPDGSPEKRFTPEGVNEPIKWLLGQVG